jgi:glucosamine-6-phosphate deaminase
MMRVRVFDDADALARACARNIARSLSARPDLVLGLPTGRTPIPLYHELVRLHQGGRADFRRATTFNLDEFLGLDARDSRSYRAFMQRHLFDHVNVAPRRIHFLNGTARNVARECDRYERAIWRAGGIDLQILGLGMNGHIGFNEPARALVARTHCTRLKPGTRRANAALFGGRVSAVPREALSMGMATILQAERIVLVATGATKARCVERMINGPVTPRLPGSFLQLHRNVEVWVDRAAAAHSARLKGSPSVV